MVTKRRGKRVDREKIKKLKLFRREMGIDTDIKLEEKVAALISSPVVPVEKEEETKFEIVNVKDMYADLLPEICPERFSYFRYIGFRILKKQKVQTCGSRLTLTLTLFHQDDPDDRFTTCTNSYFKGGTYYFQDILLNQAGVYHFQVKGTTNSGKDIVFQHFHTRIQVFECLELQQCPDSFKNGKCGSIMAFVDDRIKENTQDELRDDFMLLNSTKSLLSKSVNKLTLRWWFRVYFNRVDEMDRLKYDSARCFYDDGERKHKRKQVMPIRSGTEKEHVCYFNGKARELRLRTRRQIRIFTLEPLSAEETLVLYSTKQFYQQLKHYASN